MGNLGVARRLVVLVLCAHVARVHTLSIGTALNWAFGTKQDGELGVERAETELLSLDRIYGPHSAAPSPKAYVNK